ncbi:hypothetical protein LEM8419_00801 [Neolewinella maritima]|uniref:DUF4403 family protein n=1 Tax=Neolewinella maritima TaxID=1383882 RepID=A0ABN8EZV4_9BACT|nr:hypothetical protein [Neolewinella maritima]CAH0999501.1 hypothetical protein LEM8419_00801 [Neolewinella maritima]
MPTFSNPAVATAFRDPTGSFAGTDVRIALPLTRNLLNEVLAARPSGTPITELYIDPEAGNQFRVHLAANAPVVGRVTRRITLVPGPAVTFPAQPWLQFAITDGLKFFDKPLINLVQGQVERRLPKGVDVSSSRIRIHVPALMTHLGYQAFVPLLHKIQITSEANRLQLHLHLLAAPERSEHPRPPLTP